MSSFLEGSLEGFPLSAVLRFLVQHGKEGRIRVGGRDHSAELHLRSGPRFAIRCDDPSLAIPELLVKREVISEPEASQLRSEMEASGGALETSQRYSSEELTNFARLQAHEILFEAMSWDNGQFRWTDEQTMPAGLHLFDLDIDAAEKEAQRRGAEAADRSAPAPDARFRILPQTSSVTIAADELTTLVSLGRGATFEELVRSAGGDRAVVARLIHRLRVRGIIDEEAVAAKPAAAAETPQPHVEAAAAAPVAEPEPERAPEPKAEDPFDATSRNTPAEDVWAVSQEPPPPPQGRSTLPGEIEGGSLSSTNADSELPFAVITLDDDTKTSFPLLDDQNSIGRGDHNLIRIPHGSISGTHARIDRTPAGYRLHDLNSRNGTFVNGDRVDTALLNNNDRIRLGTVYMTFSMAAELESNATVMTRLPKP